MHASCPFSIRHKEELTERKNKGELFGMDVDEYSLSSVLASHQGAIRAVCVLGDGSIVTGAQDSLAKRWIPIQVSLFVDTYGVRLFYTYR